MSSLNSDETRFLKLARQHPDGIDNDTIARELPDLTDEALMNVINTLSSKSLIQFLRKGSETIFQAKSDSEAEKMSGMDPEERLVFQQIEAAGNEGIWSKRIRIKSGLIATVVNRCIKKLEQKLLIKS
ncbi:DNA-directed RNA polymerase III subunit RPC6, partial [Tieghemiomyces parasiticus]